MELIFTDYHDVRRAPHSQKDNHVRQCQRLPHESLPRLLSSRKRCCRESQSWDEYHVTIVRFGGHTVLAVFRAFHDGYQGFIPNNAVYTSNGNFSLAGPPNGAGLRNGGRALETDFSQLNRTGNNEQFLARSPEFIGPQESAMAIARRKNCATPNSIAEQFKDEFEAQWNRTLRTGEENGSLVFYEQATNTYYRVSLSEGRHVSDRITSVPALPEIGPETRNAFDHFSRVGRTVYLLAFFHTHPNFPHSGESRSGDPSGDDIQYQSNHGNALGILRTGKGYSFFSNGRRFWPDDARANECIWILNKQRK